MADPKSDLLTEENLRSARKVCKEGFEVLDDLLKVKRAISSEKITDDDEVEMASESKEITDDDIVKYSNNSAESTAELLTEYHQLVYDVVQTHPQLSEMLKPVVSAMPRR